MKTIRLLAIFSALTLAPQALAQSYISLGFGQARTSGWSDFTTALVAGWRFGEHWGAEIAHFNTNDLGEHSGAEIVTNDLTGIGIAVTASARIAGSLSVFGKLGVYSVDREIVVTSTVPSAAANRTVKIDHGTSGSVGLGLAYAIDERIAVRALAERIDGKDNLDAVTLYSAGIELRF